MKKYFKILSFLGVVALLISAHKIIMFSDISLQPISKEDNPSFENKNISSSPGVYLVSYADGKEVFFQNQNALAASALNKGVDFIFNYRRQHLSSEFRKENSYILNQTKGAGYWLWKPWIILNTLEKVPEGAVVIYVDSGYVLKGSLKELIDLAAIHDIMLMKHNPYKDGKQLKDTVVNVVQTATLEKMKCDKELCLESPAIEASFMVFRNTIKSRAFVKEWLTHCKDAEKLMETKGNKPPLPHFINHFHDQSILSVLNYQHKRDVYLLDYPYVHEKYAVWHHRHPKEQHRTLLPQIYRKYFNILERKFFNLEPIKTLRALILKKYFNNEPPEKSSLEIFISKAPFLEKFIRLLG